MNWRQDGPTLGCFLFVLLLCLLGVLGYCGVVKL